MSYNIVSRVDAGLPANVTSSSGNPRPQLSGVSMMVAHYTGNRRSYVGADAAAITRSIQAVFAKTKPFEYNYVIGQNPDSDIIEFAGNYQAAHARGVNHDSIGVLFLVGVDDEVTDLMIDKWRWLKGVLTYFGVVRPDAELLGHYMVPGAATLCPGNSIKARWPEFLLDWQEPSAPLEPQDNTMILLDKPVRSWDSRDAGAQRPAPGRHVVSNAGFVPEAATGLCVNVTAVDAVGPGFLTLWGDGSQPLSSNLNYADGPGAISNTTFVTLASGTGSSFNIANSTGTHIVVDVIGYLVPQ